VHAAIVGTTKPARLKQNAALVEEPLRLSEYLRDSRTIAPGSTARMGGSRSYRGLAHQRFTFEGLLNDETIER
jgi:hypothetical protein